MDHIIAAVDNSESGREAARTAGEFARRTGASLTLLSVVPVTPVVAAVPTQSSARNNDLASVATMIREMHPNMPIEVAQVSGLPHIEIGRFAENRKADLVVLGRKGRTRAARIFLGDTADAVIRRSRIPCMLVPEGCESTSCILAALDGTDRGFMVFEYAAQLAVQGSMTMSAVTVDPAWPGELSMQDVWSARAERLADRIHARSTHCRKGLATLIPRSELLEVRRGDTLTQVVNVVADHNADILVIGFHRGGPSLVVDQGSVARQLIHAAPCIVITVPF
jgi:nucleotide-binding universal stress UspA family protein